MTTPQDPNQPVPGSAEPGGSAPSVWGQQPQAQAPWGAPATPPPDQPGWAALPPNEPGFGAPPPQGQPQWGQQPSQPQWGQPQGQPQWGAQPQGQPQWGQPGQPQWGQPGQPQWGQPQRSGNRHGCLIGVVIVLVLVVLGVGGCTVFALPYIQTDVKLTQDLGSAASSVSINSTNGDTVWVITLKDGYDSQAQAEALACAVVKPDLAGTKFANDQFRIVDHDGYLVADDTTPCQ